MANLACGIVGLPNVGKSTLFNALTRNAADSANYPFCTIEPNIGIVNVPDERLAALSQLSKSQKIIPAAMKFVDIAGLVEGASSGEGLGNKFLANIRETDSIVHVVRCFDSDDVVHVSGSVDPIRDIEVIHLELALADLQMIENIIAKVAKQAKGDKELKPVLETLNKVKAHLDQNLPVRSLEGLSDKEWDHLKPYRFLTNKDVLYATNISEDDLAQGGNEYVKQVREHAKKEGSIVLPICAKLEAEVAQLEEGEAREMLEALGLQESGLDRLIKASFQMLGLITFLTTGEQETRAWTIRQGTLAPEAAGAIHTDIQKGFIRAEVVSYPELLACGSRAKAREEGKIRAEGKEYEVQDGDVVLFLHN